MAESDYDRVKRLGAARQKRWRSTHREVIREKRRKDSVDLRGFREVQAQDNNNHGGDGDFDFDGGGGGNDFDFDQDHDPPAPDPPVPVGRRGRKAPAKVFTLEIVLAEIQALEGDSRRNNAVIPQTTKNVRKSSMSTVFRITASKNLVKTLGIFAKFKKTLDSATLKGSDKPMALNTKKTVAESLVWTIDHLGMNLEPAVRQQYLDMMESYKLQSKDQTKARKGDIEFDVMPYTEFLAKVKGEFGGESKQFVLASIYKEATLRDNFYNLVLVESDRGVLNDTDNFLIMSRAAKGAVTVVINSYKTEKRYGVIRVKLSAGLSKLLREYVAKKGTTAGSRIFPENKTGLSAYISTFVKKIAPGAKGGIDYIRQSVITEQMNKAGGLSAEARVALAKSCAHSPNAQLSYVRGLKA
jgi:hypothetical protein